MGRFVEGADRRQDFLLPASLDDYVSEDNPVRAVEAFIDALDLKALEFVGMTPADTGRPAYHPATMLKIYLYGYLNRVQSSRRLEREAQRNVEVMWLTGRLAPDFKTIANFRQANGTAIRAVCSQFIGLCRQLNLFTRAVVAIDGSKMKAVNNRDKNYTAAKVRSRMQQVQDNIDRYLEELDRTDRAESDIAEPKAARLTEKIARLRDQMRALEAREEEVRLAPDQQVSLTDPDARAMTSAGRGTSIVGYNLQAAVDAVPRDKQDESACCLIQECSRTLRFSSRSSRYTCALHDQCTTGKERRIKRWEQEEVVEAMERRLDRRPEAMRIRRQTVEHPFGTLKAWMGSTHFQMKTLKHVRTEISLHILAYNLKRLIAIFGVQPLITAMRT